MKSKPDPTNGVEPVGHGVQTGFPLSNVQMMIAAVQQSSETDARIHDT